MKHECIAFEAAKVYERNNSLSSDECWKIVEENLSIFSNHVVSIPNMIIGGYDYKGVKDGSFGILTKNNTLALDHCRELFEHKAITMWNSVNHSYDSSGFYYIVCPTVQHKLAQVAYFIREAENRLNLVHLSKFCRTNRGDAIWVVPSDFWKQNTMRISVMTILLRCGISYDNDWDRALVSHAYAAQTIEALKVFMSGRTKFIGRHDWNSRRNWVYVFNQQSKQQAEGLLVA